MKWGAAAAAPDPGFVPLAAAGFASTGPLVPAGAPPPPPAPPPTSEGHRHEARVELVRDGDVVRGLVIVCLCGERIEVECLY